MAETDKARERWVTAGLIVLTTVVFLSGLFGDFIYDDDLLINGNSYIRDPALLREAMTHDFWHTSSAGGDQEVGNSYYRPLVTLAYVVQFQLFGENPVGYHVVSLGLHLACVLLAFVWLRRRLEGSALALPAIFAGALVFAIHPARVESVSWISGSTDLWMTLFVLLGWLAWDRVRGTPGPLLAAVAFALAVLAKEAAIAAPVLLFTDALLLSPDAAERRSRLRRAVVPLAAVVVVVVLRVALVPLRMAANGESAWGSFQRIASSLGYYVARAIWPWPPSMQVGWQRVDESGVIAYVPWTVVLGITSATCLAALVWLAWRRPSVRPLLADAAWFVLPLLPVLNLLPLSLQCLVAPRYLYLPLLGLSAVVVRIARRGVTAERMIRRAAMAVGTAMMLACVAVAVYHQAKLRDDDTFWTYENALAPDNPFAAKMLAQLRLRQGRHAESLSLIERSYGDSHGQAVAQADLVLLAAQVVLAATSDADQPTLGAVRRFFDDLAAGRPARLVAGGLDLSIRPSTALRRRILDDVDDFQVPRAMAHARTLDLSVAERLLRETVANVPSAPGAWANLALVEARQERWDDAEAAAEAGLRARPDDPFLAGLQRQIAAARDREASVAGADPVIRELVSLELRIGLGGIESARRDLGALIAERPNDPRPVLLRLRADIAEGRFDLARATIAAARQRDPGNGQLWDALWSKLLVEEMRRTVEVP